MLKEKIVFENAIVENNFIHIDNEHTMFVKKTRIDFPNINQLEKEVKALRKTLRDKGVKLNKTDTLKLLRERKHEYNTMINEYNDTFDKLVEGWRKKLKDGLYVGYGSDDFYNNVLKELKFKLDRMGYTNTILSRVREIERDVKEVKKDLEEGVNFISVSI